MPIFTSGWAKDLISDEIGEQHHVHSTQNDRKLRQPIIRETLLGDLTAIQSQLDELKNFQQRRISWLRQHTTLKIRCFAGHGWDTIISVFHHLLLAGQQHALRLTPQR